MDDAVARRDAGAGRVRPAGAVRAPMYGAAMLSARLLRRATWKLLTGTGAVGLIAAPAGSARPAATASRSCAFQNAFVRSASTAELRSATVCLINRFRSRGGLPWLREQRQLTAAAQRHTDQMVADHYFGHGGTGGSNPALRISAAGFDWGAYGEAISTGFQTPRRTVSAWLGSVVHCQILLSPEYRYIGVGVNRYPVAGWAKASGTWTADLALPLGWAAPSRRWGLADRCPY